MTVSLVNVLEASSSETSTSSQRPVTSISVTTVHWDTPDHDATNVSKASMERRITLLYAVAVLVYTLGYSLEQENKLSEINYD